MKLACLRAITGCFCCTVAAAAAAAQDAIVHSYWLLPTLQKQMHSRQLHDICPYLSDSCGWNVNMLSVFSPSCAAASYI